MIDSGTTLRLRAAGRLKKHARRTGLKCVWVTPSQGALGWEERPLTVLLALQQFLRVGGWLLLLRPSERVSSTQEREPWLILCPHTASCQLPLGSPWLMGVF